MAAILENGEQSSLFPRACNKNRSSKDKKEIEKQITEQKEKNLFREKETNFLRKTKQDKKQNYIKLHFMKREQEHLSIATIFRQTDW